MQREAMLAGNRDLFGTKEEGIAAELSGWSVKSHLGAISAKRLEVITKCIWL